MKENLHIKNSSQLKARGPACLSQKSVTHNLGGRSNKDFNLTAPVFRNGHSSNIAMMISSQHYDIRKSLGKLCNKLLSQARSASIQTSSNGLDSKDAKTMHLQELLAVTEDVDNDSRKKARTTHRTSNDTPGPIQMLGAAAKTGKTTKYRTGSNEEFELRNNAGPVLECTMGKDFLILQMSRKLLQIIRGSGEFVMSARQRLITFASAAGAGSVSAIPKQKQMDLSQNIQSIS
jgi:hypothetical protein